MIFTETTLRGAYVIDVEPHADFRGLFARTWDVEAFAARGLETGVAQCSVSFNNRRGTLRGMHFQRPPFAECKIVRCTRGAFLDVIVDLRRESPTFLRHVAVELSADNRRALYIPAGFAHGFQTLVDSTEVFYQMNVGHAPAHAGGIRWNDPALGIEWPIADPIILDRDAAYPDVAQAVLV